MAAPAVLMDARGGHLFASTAFASNEDRAVAIPDNVQELEDGSHPGVVTHDK